MSSSKRKALLLLFPPKQGLPFFSVVTLFLFLTIQSAGNKSTSYVYAQVPTSGIHSCNDCRQANLKYLCSFPPNNYLICKDASLPRPGCMDCIPISLTPTPTSIPTPSGGIPDCNYCLKAKLKYLCPLQPKNGVICKDASISGTGCIDCTNHTISPTSSSNPTGIGGTTLSLTIGMHGIGSGGDNANPTGQGNTSPRHTTQSLTVTLYDLQNAQTAQAQGQVNFIATSGIYNGTIALNNVQTGDYQVKLQAVGFLTKRLSQLIHITAGQVTSIPQVPLVNGDIDTNNQVDILDYNDLVNCFGSKQSASSCKFPPTQQTQGADIDDDGSVGGSDYNLFLREISVQPGA